ncbi:MAG TPA: 30S ribosomal protein S17 [Phycisphaerae bacterium]|nr:30S ribosomal protein S17 [Phycisphaerae bacterium]HNU44462.1 30S ribosomal protein S17 [Phycisphaerae bacterium]
MTQTEVTQARGATRGRLVRRTGTVVSAGRQKTIKIRCDYLAMAPKYGKYVRRRTTLHAHDEKNEAKVGDVVEVAACRRLSKTKAWRLLRIVRRIEGGGA